MHLVTITGDSPLQKFQNIQVRLTLEIGVEIISVKHLAKNKEK